MSSRSKRHWSRPLLFKRFSLAIVPRVSESAPQQDSSVDRLLKEYSRTFQTLDDLTLARWCAQTLGQICGSVWRASHPLIGAYRLAAEVAHGRRLWSQKLVNIPHGYQAASCCRAPFLPLFTREVVDHGLVCQHCHETLVPLDEMPGGLLETVKKWAAAYQPLHEVAHWDEQRQAASDYDAKFENAAQQVEDLLVEVATLLAPRMLDHYPAVIWEDQDECLEVRPEDIEY